VLVAFALRGPAMRVLYSERFAPAAVAAGVLMVGDVLKALSWALAGPLLYRGHLRVFAALELCGAAAMALPALLLVPRFGAAGAAGAVTVGYGLYLGAAAVALRGACGVAVPYRRLMAAASFAVALLGAAWGGLRWPVVDVLAGALGATLLWRAGAWRLVSRRLGPGPGMAG
jgi:O-antigen/teichoic acid export membrane protein